MAAFNLQRLLSQLKNLFRIYGDIFPGYEISDGDVESKGGQCSAEYTYQPTIAGDTTDVRVVISTVNVEEAFDTALDFIDKLSWDSIKNNLSTFEGLTGLKLLADDVKLENIALDAIEQNGKGLLGTDFTKVKPDQLDPTWREYALEKLKYNLLCETAADDAGKVDNQSLMNCVKWIHSYMDFVRSNRDNIRDSEKDRAVGVEVKEQLSEQEKNARKEDNNRQISSENDAIQLVMPILARIQGELKKMYQDKLNSDLDVEYEEDEEKPEEDDEQNSSDNSTSEVDEDAARVQRMKDMGFEFTGKLASKHISVTLKKIQASSDLEILSLDSNYLPGDTLDDIDEIINQDEFVDVLTEEPQTFDIKVDDDGFDIEKCEECGECDPCASLCEVFKSGIRAYRNLYILHWMSSGNDMMKLHNLSEEMYDELKDEIDTVGELLVEKQGTVPQLDFPCDYIPVQKYDFQTGLDQIKSLIQMYIDCIDYAYCNQDSDVQSTLDEWLRYWKKQLNYFVERQEV